MIVSSVEKEGGKETEQATKGRGRRCLPGGRPVTSSEGLPGNSPGKDGPSREEREFFGGLISPFSKKEKKSTVKEWKEVLRGEKRPTSRKTTSKETDSIQSPGEWGWKEERRQFADSLEGGRCAS